jgi:hypothetical protein
MTEARALNAEDPKRNSEAGDLEAAALRAYWRESPERRRTMIVGWLIALTCILLSIVGAFIGKDLAVLRYQRLLYALYGAGLTLLATGYIASLIFMVYRGTQRRAVRDRRVLGIAKVELDKAEADVGDESRTDFGTLWKVTQKRLDYYHKIATSQAERSFL